MKICVSSWDMERDRQIFFWFWTIFCPFTLVTTQKIKILTKMKNTPGSIIILQKCIKIMIICYTFLGILRVTDVIVIFSFWAVFSPFTSVTPEKSKFKKNEKDAWRYQFIYVYQKLWSDDVRFLRYGAQRTDGRTEKVTYRGGWPT